MTPAAARITVFYDGRCGLCRREIAHYRRIAPPQRFWWVDLTQTPEPLLQQGYPVADGLRRLHVLDGDGRLRIGLQAFITIWRELARWRWLAAVARLPGVYPLAERAYRLFADGRFRRWGYDSARCPWSPP